MYKLKTFKLGGVHPPDNKLSATSSIVEFPLPSRVIIPLQQNLGAPPKAIVRVGDKVKVGQLIAQADGFISSNLHSSVSGTISKIDDVMSVSGYKKPAFIIDVEGDEWIDVIERNSSINNEIKHSQQEIIEIIKNAGIVGMGGATFPTNVKLMPHSDKVVEYLIINGVECEPYLTADHRLMIEHSKEIFIGIMLLQKALSAKIAYIGLESNKPDAIELLDKESKNYSNIKIIALKPKYPQGSEKQLIKAITNKSLPSGKLPIEVGCVVINVGTCFAVYEAVQKNKPLIDRIVTVTGKHISTPSNFKVRIGTLISEIIERAGGLPKQTGKIVSGGPMMGKAIISSELPVIKGTSGIVAFDKTECNRLKIMNCIRCGRCLSVCPMGLEPILLAQLSNKLMVEQLIKESILNCIECGSCQYTCPANRPLLDNIRIGKAKANIFIRNNMKK